MDLSWIGVINLLVEMRIQSSSFLLETLDRQLHKLKKQKKVCNRCIVKEPCLAWALESGQDAGVWGGLSEDERRALKRRAARNRARLQEQNQINNPA